MTFPIRHAPPGAVKLRDAIADMVDRYGASERAYVLATRRCNEAAAARAGRAASRQYRCILRLTHALMVAMTATEASNAQ